MAIISPSFPFFNCYFDFDIILTSRPVLFSPSKKVNSKEKIRCLIVLHAHRRFESSENPTTYVVFAASRLRDPKKPMAFWGEEEQYYRRIFASQNGAHIYLLRRYDTFEFPIEIQTEVLPCTCTLRYRRFDFAFCFAK